MRSGLTLLETLLAVALLAILTAGISGWITSTASIRSTSDHYVEWPAQTEAVFRLIAEELMQGDRSVDEDDFGARLPEIGDTGVKIQTRAPGYGMTSVVYEFDRAESRLARTIDSDPESNRRTVLDHVAAFGVELIAPAEADESIESGASAHTLLITIRSTEGVESSRRFVLRW